MEVATFTCSICGEASRAICVYCTKDACSNHVCQRCHRCSDCCACDMPVTSGNEEETRAQVTEPATAVPEQVPELVTPASSVPGVSFSDAEPDQELILDRR